MLRVYLPARTGSGTSVRSLAELALVEEAGFRGKDVLCHGHDPELLERCVLLGARVVLGTLGDFKALDEVLRGFRGRFAAARVGVRLPRDEGPELIELLQRVTRHRGLQLDLLYADAAAGETRRSLRRLDRLRRDLEAAGAGPVTTLCLGGALAAYPSHHRKRWEQFYARLAAAAPVGVQLAIEPETYFFSSGEATSPASRDERNGRCGA